MNKKLGKRFSVVMGLILFSSLTGCGSDSEKTKTASQGNPQDPQGRANYEANFPHCRNLLDTLANHKNFEQGIEERGYQLQLGATPETSKIIKVRSDKPNRVLIWLHVKPKEQNEKLSDEINFFGSYSAITKGIVADCKTKAKPQLRDELIRKAAASDRLLNELEVIHFRGKVNVAENELSRLGVRFTTHFFSAAPVRWNVTPSLISNPSRASKLLQHHASVLATFIEKYEKKMGDASKAGEPAPVENLANANFMEFPFATAKLKLVQIANRELTNFADTKLLSEIIFVSAFEGYSQSIPEALGKLKSVGVEFDEHGRIFANSALRPSHHAPHRSEPNFAEPSDQLLKKRHRNNQRAALEDFIVVARLVLNNARYLGIQNKEIYALRVRQESAHLLFQDLSPIHDN